MASRYRRKPKPKKVGAAARKVTDGSLHRPNEAIRPSQPRAISSHTALERNEATTAVVATRAGPARSTGDPPVTYHAERQRNPYDTDSGTATISASVQPSTPWSASSAASSTPSGSQMPM